MIMMVRSALVYFIDGKIMLEDFFFKCDRTRIDIRILNCGPRYSRYESQSLHRHQAMHWDCTRNFAMQLQPQLQFKTLINVNELDLCFILV